MNIGDSVDIDISLKRRDGTPITDASEVTVTVYRPNGTAMTPLELNNGVTNLGSGNYRAEMVPDAPGAYRARVRAVSPTGKIKNLVVDFQVKKL